MQSHGCVFVPDLPEDLINYHGAFDEGDSLDLFPQISMSKTRRRYCVEYGRERRAVVGRKGPQLFSASDRYPPAEEPFECSRSNPKLRRQSARIKFNMPTLVDVHENFLGK